VLLNTSVLCPAEEFKQDAKIIVKVLVNVIRKGIHFQQTESRLCLGREGWVRF
jgi:hypothetical protein